MNDRPNRGASRLDPTVAWTLVTDAPLAGVSLAREAGLILVWDEAGHVQVLNLRGEQQAEDRVPSRVLAGVISDNGERIALLVVGTRLILLDAELTPMADRLAPGDPTGLAIDPHGRYIAVSSRTSETELFTRHGKPAGSFATMHPLAHLRFVPDRPLILAASAIGSLYAIDLSPESAGSLYCEERWRSQIMSNVGRLGITGDGGVILASCYTYGIQRFDARGRNEGAYHLGGTVAHAVPDFLGRSIAVATTEGELALLNSAGHVRWKTGLPRGPIALEFDALGRFIIYGLPTGEVARLDLESPMPGALDGVGGPRKVASSSRSVSGSGAQASGGSSLRQPAWQIPVAQTDDQAETAVLAVLDEPERVAAVTSRNKLQVFTPDGTALEEGPSITGVGRILRTAPGWIASATDRYIVLFDVRSGTIERLDMSLAELTHLVLAPDAYGLAIVQERDRVGRATVAGRWVWKRELRTPVEDLAVGPEARTAVSTEDGQLLIFNAAGEPAGKYHTQPSEPLAMTAAPSGSPAEVVWLTLARSAQILRGHRGDGRPVWESPVPWEAWQMHPLPSAIVIEAVDGRAIAFDGSGHAGAQSRSESSPGAFFAGPEGVIGRVIRQGEHLICSDLHGRVLWRAIAPEPIGPLAAGRSGVAALIGRALAWYPHPLPDATD